METLLGGTWGAFKSARTGFPAGGMCGVLIHQSLLHSYLHFAIIMINPTISALSICFQLLLQIRIVHSNPLPVPAEFNFEVCTVSAHSNHKDL